ncbi:sensor domain-containing diguanylate cyclase [Paenibacillus shenyangensis]|uniref:sensor domain-containing diguanylate cyclase n=1 Tax=Paenibacillus sp. A9 TaxID=1284352 RepID=UPI00037F76A8|nr:sensor domain-containing diguanylate cyclase [Paenibacillus sp. A9]
MSDAQNKENQPLNRSLLKDGGYVTQEPIDLTNCDREPIHIPGRIQPHGVLLAVTKDSEHQIVQCSANSGELLGRPVDELLGQPLEAIIGEEQLFTLLKGDLRAEATSDLQYTEVAIEVGEEIVDFFVVLHESEGLIILELEISSKEDDRIFNEFEWIRSFFNLVKQTSSRAEASRAAAEQIQDMLGYDRVMIYEFDQQWNGKVIAEAKTDDLEPFLGHHYPASDIPKQARALYLRNWLRVIVDVNYEPVDVLPAVQPLTGKPLNLSLSVLRSVSPLHIEYLHNMGVGATLTISLIHDNQLWGLITCHHYSPKYISHRLRNLCNFLGSFFSSELYQRQQLDSYEGELQLRKQALRISSIFTGATNAVRVAEQLQDEEETLLDLMSASGAAVSYQDKLLLYGVTPSPGQIRELAGWLGSRSRDYAYATSRLSLEYESAKTYKDKASGALYLAISPGQQNYIIWFRPEVVQVVDWAGDPAKAVIQEDDGVRLSPRKSFEKWRQVVQSTSLPWQNKELNILPELKSIVHQQTENQLRQIEDQALQDARTLRRNEQRYMQLMEMSPVAFFTLTNRHIIYSNNQAAELLGVGQSSELVGRDFLQFVQDNFKSDMISYLDQLEQNLIHMISNNSCFQNVEGESIKLELTLASISYGSKPSVMIIAREAQQEAGLTEAYTVMSDQLQSYMATDPLTDMPNRIAFEKKMLDDWYTAIQQNQQVSLLLIDIDDLREYNAIHGLNGGDLCVQWVGDVLNVVSSKYSADIARFSGGTFMMKIQGCAEEQVFELADEIRSNVLALQIPTDMSNSGEYITVSVGGIILTPDPLMHPTDLILRAEEALMQAKNMGKNQVSFL